MYTVSIKTGKERVFLKHNPWVFTGAIESTSPAFEKAGIARVQSAEGRFIAYGWLDGQSHITLHLMSWKEDVIPDDAWLKERIKDAVMARAPLFSAKGTNCFRLVHGEADFIPGLAVDAYGSQLRIIISSRYAEDHLPIIIQALVELTSCKHCTVTVDASFAPLEGLKRTVRHFDEEGKETKEEGGSITFCEDSIWYESDGGTSQKSGFYCDQRENRRIVGSYAKGRRVLDGCSYTGGFTLHCLREGASSVHAVDASEGALRHLLYQVHLNEDRETLPEGSRSRVTTECADIFTWMRTLEEGRFDMIILDPPKLAPTKAKLEKAMAAYKDLNRLAMQKVASGGIIATFSCSGALSWEDFRRMTAWAAADAHAEVQILEQLSAGPDHPVRVSLPETEYLKGLVLRVSR